MAVGIGLLGGNGVELGIVVELELHGGVGDGIVQGVEDGDGEAAGGGIDVCDVDFRETRLTADDLLGAIIVSKDLGVHQHSP